MLMIWIRYVEGYGSQAGRHRGLGFYLVSNLYYSSTFLNCYRKTNRTKVLDRLYDGCMGHSVYGSCCDEEPCDFDRVAVTAWGF